MKIVRRLLLFALLVAFLVWQWPRIKAQILPVFTKTVQTKKPLTEAEVLDQINTYRTNHKMLAVKRNDKLDKAALARLRVVISDNDFSGDKTGISRENAVRNNDYTFSVVGDLFASGVDGDTKLVDSWSKDADIKKTLDEKAFRDIGISISQDGLGWQVMVIMARQMSAPAEKMGAGGYPIVTWGGPELWEAINKRRVELGVGQLSKKDELCTIASIRLNQLLELGKLDGHEGFEPTLSRFPDLRQKYNISEFLIVGYPTPAEAVAAWEHTLGHRGLLAGGEYVWGCVYAQNTFGVAIAAY